MPVILPGHGTVRYRRHTRLSLDHQASALSSFQRRGHPVARLKVGGPGQSKAPHPETRSAKENAADEWRGSLPKPAPIPLDIAEVAVRECQRILDRQAEPFLNSHRHTVGDKVVPVLG